VIGGARIEREEYVGRIGFGEFSIGKKKGEATGARPDSESRAEIGGENDHAPFSGFLAFRRREGGGRDVSVVDKETRSSGGEGYIAQEDRSAEKVAIGAAPQSSARR
jgi:hypothetical protein